MLSGLTAHASRWPAAWPEVVMLQDADFQKISGDTQRTVLLGHLRYLTINTCCLAFPPGTRTHLVIAGQRYMDAAGLSPVFSHYFY